MIKTPKSVPLPQIAPSITGDLRNWLVGFSNIIKETFSKIRQDFEQGNAQHKILDTTPSVNDLEEGEIVLVSNATTKRLYTRIGDSVYYIDLTLG